MIMKNFIKNVLYYAPCLLVAIIALGIIYFVFNVFV